MLVFEKEGVEFNLEFPSRCFLCLVDISNSFKAAEGYDNGEQFQVHEFQKVFNHLVPNDDNKGSVTFAKTPPICEFCGPILNTICAALEQLTSATNAVKSRIENLGKDELDREERLHSFLSNFMGVVPKLQWVQEALNLLARIGHGPFPEVSSVLSPSISAGTDCSYLCKLICGPSDFFLHFLI